MKMDNNIEKLETYLNRNGFPMLRRCKNCIHWKEYNPKDNIGFCTLMPLYFAFTLQQTVYGMTRDFCLCEKHKFENEDKLYVFSEKRLLKDVIKKKDEIL
jgi:hypothetical protein